MLALAAQRFLPLFQQSYNAWSRLQSSKSGLFDLRRFSLFLNEDISPLDEKFVKSKRKLKFKKKIDLIQINFSYSPKKKVLSNKSIELLKGKIIGISGKSGTGKSTLLNIILGLIKANSGKTVVDGKIIDPYHNVLYQNLFSLVPQDIFIFNDSLKRNVILNNHYNKKRYFNCLKVVGLLDELSLYINDSTLLLGENGSALSGGQKQKVGIARGLYSNSDIVILDEPTSAMDEKNEDLLICELKRLRNKKTFIIVSHSHTVLSNCDYTYNFITTR
jgi:ABC-type bacteriocin/lantibiotic exporter with double-glycine peptidase domain